VIDDPAQSGIVRATALSLLVPSAGPGQAERVARAARDPDPLVRRAAATAAANAIPPGAGVPVLTSLLADPIRTVRLEAVGELATTSGRPLIRRSAPSSIVSRMSSASHKPRTPSGPSIR